MLAIAHFHADDRAGEAQAMLNLMVLGHARQCEVSRAFDRSARTVRRIGERFEGGGLAAVGRPPGYPAGRPRLKASRVKELEQLKAEGVSNRQIALQWGVDEKALLLVAKLWKQDATEAASHHRTCPSVGDLYPP